MRVVGYLRVSTDRQADRGVGLTVQDKGVRAWAKANGHRLVSIHRDEGVSGSNGLDSRIGLYEALGALRDGRADGLVVYRLDRLARDLVLQEQLLAELRRIDRQVFSTMAGEQAYLTDDADDPSRTMIRQVLGAVNQYEAKVIALRLRSGRSVRRTAGNYVGDGAPPYGWRVADAPEGGGKVLLPVEREQQALRLMRRLHAEGKSLPAIASALAEAGHKPRRGERWHPNTLRKVLRRTDPPAGAVTA